MRRIILAILTFAFCHLWAEVKVEKVLETTSVKKYNQWVKKNKAKYPGLKPYYLKTECIKWGKEWKVYYYNEDGNLRKEELLKAKPGWWLYVSGESFLGKVVVTESDSFLGESSPIIYTIKNEEGKKMFSFEWGFDYETGKGVYALPNGIGLFRSNSLENYAEILTWDGKIIGRIDGFLRLDAYSSAEMLSIASPDNKFMLLSGGGTTVYIKDGKEIWRKTSPSGRLSISNDGEYVSIGANAELYGTIYLYNYNGELIYSYKFPDKSRGIPTSKFSSDNKYLVAEFGEQKSLLNNITGEPLWLKKCEGTIVSFAKNNEYITFVDIKAQKIYIYNTLGNLQDTINAPYGEDIKKKRTKEGEIIESKVLYSNWTCEVFDDLIITNSGREWHPIIYKIK